MPASNAPEPLAGLSTQQVSVQGSPVPDAQDRGAALCGSQRVPRAAPLVQSLHLATHSPPPSGCHDGNRRDHVPWKGVFSGKAPGVAIRPDSGSVAPGTGPGSSSVSCLWSLPSAIYHLEGHTSVISCLQDTSLLASFPPSFPADHAARSPQKSTQSAPTSDRPGLYRSKFKVLTWPEAPCGLILTIVLIPAPLLL